eukprot:CAMPEP_0184370908 /NCGR_PEP_ID=MMETSP1089-20130417/163089_1 /TAXON_ID=38269 ORGANISM="Gloeochaete wittrockiana, Strain SAG46.84" /NCGR_SAMPLE_ID=MMETSP1089 /ASSEMBLY_ACC=CAM_ASM_000445 /LENGTH=1423 /DNA_ID=CAMNT_0026713591 /DNA_START=297 /DNA_END=4568 /DNA_ORIENTATION=+
MVAPTESISTVVLTPHEGEPVHLVAEQEDIPAPSQPEPRRPSSLILYPRRDSWAQASEIIVASHEIPHPHVELMPLEGLQMAEVPVKVQVNSDSEGNNNTNILDDRVFTSIDIFPDNNNNNNKIGSSTNSTTSESYVPNLTAQRPLPKVPRTDVFVSYSHKNDVQASNIMNALSKANKSVWLDKKDIRAGWEWREEVRQGIERADCSLFLLSPDWLRSEECSKELNVAISMHKRMIPVLIGDCLEAPAELASKQWVYLRATDDFNVGMDTLVMALNTDEELVKTHTNLLLRSEEWAVAFKDDSRLLQKKELTAAEAWLPKAYQKGPIPTNLQMEYIAASQRRRTKHHAQWKIGVTAIIAILAIFLAGALAATIVALQSRSQAIASEQEAQYAKLLEQTKARAGLAKAMANDGDPIAIRIAAENYNIALTQNLPTKTIAEDGLREVLRFRLPTILSDSLNFLSLDPTLLFFTFSPDDNWLFASLQDTPAESSLSLPSLVSVLTVAWDLRQYPDEAKVPTPIVLGTPTPSLLVNSAAAEKNNLPFKQIAIAPDSSYFVVISTPCMATATTIASSSSCKTDGTASSVMQFWKLPLLRVASEEITANNAAPNCEWAVPFVVYSTLIYTPNKIASIGRQGAENGKVSLFLWKALCAEDECCSNLAIFPNTNTAALNLTESALLLSCDNSALVIVDILHRDTMKVHMLFDGGDVSTYETMIESVDDPSIVLARSRVSQDCGLVTTWTNNEIISIPLSSSLSPSQLQPALTHEQTIGPRKWANYHQEALENRRSCSATSRAKNADKPISKVCEIIPSMTASELPMAISGASSWDPAEVAHWLKDINTMKHPAQCNPLLNTTTQRQSPWTSQMRQSSFVAGVTPSGLVIFQKFPTRQDDDEQKVWSNFTLPLFDERASALISPSSRFIASYSKSLHELAIWPLTTDLGVTKATPSIELGPDWVLDFRKTSVAPAWMENVVFAQWGPLQDMQMHPNGNWIGFIEGIWNNNTAASFYRVWDTQGHVGEPIRCPLRFRTTIAFRFGKEKNIAFVFYNSQSSGWNLDLITFDETTGCKSTPLKLMPARGCDYNQPWLMASVGGTAEPKARFLYHDSYILTACQLFAVTSSTNISVAYDFSLHDECITGLFDLSPGERFLVIRSPSRVLMFDLSVSPPLIQSFHIDENPIAIKIVFSGFLPNSSFCDDISCFAFYTSTFSDFTDREVIYRCQALPAFQCSTIEADEWPSDFSILREGQAATRAALRWSPNRHWYALLFSGSIRLYERFTKKSLTLYINANSADYSRFPAKARCGSGLTISTRFTADFSGDGRSFAYRYLSHIRIFDLTENAGPFDNIEYYPPAALPVLVQLWRVYVYADSVVYHISSQNDYNIDLVLMVSRNSGQLARKSCAIGRHLTVQEQRLYFGREIDHPLCT